MKFCLRTLRAFHRLSHIARLRLHVYLACFMGVSVIDRAGVNFRMIRALCCCVLCHILCHIFTQNIFSSLARRLSRIRPNIASPLLYQDPISSFPHPFSFQCKSLHFIHFCYATRPRSFFFSHIDFGRMFFSTFYFGHAFIDFARNLFHFRRRTS